MASSRWLSAERISGPSMTWRRVTPRSRRLKASPPSSRSVRAIAPRQLRSHGVEPVAFGGADQRPVDDMAPGHAAQPPAEGEPAILLRLADPAAILQPGQQIEALGDVLRGGAGALAIRDDLRVEGA